MSKEPFWCKIFGFVFPKRFFKPPFPASLGGHGGKLLSQCPRACPLEFGHGKASQANGWHWWSIWERGRNFCFQLGFQKRQKAEGFRITYSNPFSHLYLRLTQKWPMPSPADGLAIKHTAAHTWHSSISARQPPQSRSHLYVFGAGMWEWVEGPGCEKHPQMFYKKKANL